MANIKFSQFTQKTTLGTVDFLVGYTGADNVQIDPADLLSDYSQGTGAAGQVTFFSATSTVTGDNNLYWDNTNKKLGIGTTTPSASLHVNPSSGGNGEVNVERTSGTIINLQAQSALGVIGTNSNHDLAFKTNGNAYVRLKTNGNVGIGTSSPSSKLQVSGTLDATGISQLGSGGSNVYLTSSSAGNVGIGTSSPSAKLEIAGGADSVVLVTGTTTAARLDIKTNSHHRFLQTIESDGRFRLFNQTTNTEQLSVLSDGKVGIGTSSPLGKLQVNEYIVGSQGNQTIHGELSVFANNGDESLYLGVKDAAYPNRGWAFNPVITGVNSDLQIKEHGQTGVRMTLQSQGNVGIGTTNPDSPLEVQFQETTGQSKVMMHLDYNPGDNYGSGLFRMSAGTNSTAVTEIEQVTSGGNGDFGTYNDTNIINRSLGSISSGNINFITGSNTSASSIVMRICGGPSKGRVGIGTSSPSEKLHVAGNINFGDSHSIGDDGNDNLLLQSSSGEAVIINGDTNVRLQDGGNTKLTTTSTGVEVTGSVKADGNIALGNISGVARLQHEGSGQLKMLSSGDSAIGTFTSTGTTFPSDIETTSSSKGLILKSPDGTRYRVTVANGGTLSVSAV